MGLASSLFSGISGLSTLGNAMTVIGDNIANVNTVGFKSSRVTFQDVLSQTVATTAGTAQVGRGTSLADITASFSQGSFESTDSTTDLAIGGKGFFIVRDPGSQSEYYSRAGEFRFDKDGNFTNPAGYIVRGWELTTLGEDMGSITDVTLTSFTSPPDETGTLTLITNLDADASSKSLDLAQAWDGTDTDGDDNYISSTAYEYQSTLKVYDSLGSTHDISIYFDAVDGAKAYDYIVTCNPGEDKRAAIPDTTDTGLGMLGKGRITFNEASGKITDISFSKFIGDAGGLSIDAVNDWDLTGGTDPTSTVYGEWTGSSLGDYIFTAAASGDIGTDLITLTGSGEATGSTVTIPADYTAGTILGSTAGLPDGIELSFTAGTITILDALTITAAAGDANELDETADPNSWATMTDTHDVSSDGYFTLTADFLGGSDTTMNAEMNFGSSCSSGVWTNASLSTSQYSSASTTIFQSADGYGAGDLQSVTVGTDGAITGSYSNGQVIPLYRVALAKFQNNQALFKVGGNLFKETRLSGDPITGKPGSSGLGSISPNSLEQSNVDIANEFVKMITTQRGFQANSKIITVTDQMLAELINLKR